MHCLPPFSALTQHSPPEVLCGLLHPSFAFSILFIGKKRSKQINFQKIQHSQLQRVSQYCASEQLTGFPNATNTAPSTTEHSVKKLLTGNSYALAHKHTGHCLALWWLYFPSCSQLQGKTSIQHTHGVCALWLALSWPPHWGHPCLMQSTSTALTEDCMTTDKGRRLRWSSAQIATRAWENTTWNNSPQMGRQTQRTAGPGPPPPRSPPSRRCSGNRLLLTNYNILFQEMDSSIFFKVIKTLCKQYDTF